MIAFYLTYEYDRKGTCHGACAVRYDGTIIFLSSSTTVLLGESPARGEHVRRNKVTIFDDSHNPPKLIREDYPMKKLRKFKYLDLPSSYIDDRGNIVNAKGETLMEGPR